MLNNPEFKSLEQLMAEADELIQKINSDDATGIKEEHRLQFEKHAQNFKKIQSEVQGKTGKTGLAEIASSTDGMHEAIQDIVKAFQELKSFAGG
ncbi:MAG: hypothetical protein C4518_05230 [Desulfobacteraceae bacterium]|nr:MAG: hypothetical protein C4518_05230 [Desulfobacteraceae bacterium]